MVQSAILDYDRRERLDSTVMTYDNPLVQWERKWKNGNRLVYAQVIDSVPKVNRSTGLVTNG